MIFEEIVDNFNMNSRLRILDVITRLFQIAFEEGISDRNPAR